MSSDHDKAAAASAPAPGGAPILQVKNLGMSFNGVAALKDLSFAVRTGEIFGIAGPNGAGKTTLFNVISGLYAGTGSIVFRSQDISSAKPHRICHLGMARTLQVPHIFSTLSVCDNVRFGAHFGKAWRRSENQLIEDALEFTGLSARRHDPAEHLGLYQKKRLMIACALATEPSLLLLDEPVGGLSPVEISPLIHLVQRINRELDITVIIIEHLMKVLKALSHRMMIIHYGETISVGSPDAVMADEKVKAVYLG